MEHPSGKRKAECCLDNGMAGSWKTLKDQRFARRKQRINPDTRHTEWLGDEKLGTFGPAAPAVSLVTGEVLQKAASLPKKIVRPKRRRRKKGK
jgi:hypothetical protein